MRKYVLAGIAGLVLTACASERPLHDMRTATGGPDDFSVLPTRPLEIPETLASLPAPTPGGANLTDPTPNADAVAALGGRASAVRAGGIPAGDAALVARAGRHGVNPAIRSELATADAAFRKRKSIGGFFNFLGNDRYFKAYANMALDAFAELRRFRNLGVATPSAPPAN